MTPIQMAQDQLKNDETVWPTKSNSLVGTIAALRRVVRENFDFCAAVWKTTGLVLIELEDTAAVHANGIDFYKPHFHSTRDRDAGAKFSLSFNPEDIEEGRIIQGTKNVNLHEAHLRNKKKANWMGLTSPALSLEIVDFICRSDNRYIADLLLKNYDLKELQRLAKAIRP